MTPGAYNLKIRRGVAFSCTFTFTEDDGTTPIALTGWVPYASVRKVPTGAVILDLAPVLTDGAAGIVTISFTAAQTAALTAGNFRWDLVLKNPSLERVGPYIEGLCDISTLITRP